jgi:hypothetical protein
MKRLNEFGMAAYICVNAAVKFIATVFYVIGKFSELPYDIKMPSRQDAHDALREFVTDVTTRQR